MKVLGLLPKFTPGGGFARAFRFQPRFDFSRDPARAAEDLSTEAENLFSLLRAYRT